MLIVVKVGGSVVEHTPELVYDIKNVLSNNQIVLVHGGGKIVTEVASKLGKEQKFIVSPKGFSSRYTDKETMEIFTMVVTGKINKLIVATLQKQGVAAVGLSGLDGLIIQAERKKRLVIIDENRKKRVINGGYTGKITSVDTRLLKLLIGNRYLPVIAPVAVSEEVEPLNVDADRTAAYLAGNLKADRLILLTDVRGVILNNKLISKLYLSEIDETLPKIGAGMITKVYASMEALNLGVDEVIITRGFGTQPISSSLRHEQGTVISRE